MIIVSHSPVNTVMTEQPRQLLHMDTIGLSQVRSVGGKWYVIIIVDDYSRYSWVSSWRARMKCLNTFRASL
jgi:hypothetical protein